MDVLRLVEQRRGGTVLFFRDAALLLLIWLMSIGGR